MLIVDTLLRKGLVFVLEQIQRAAEAALDDDSAVREELLALQMRAELGEVTEAERVAIERALLDRLREIRRRRAAAHGEEAPAGGLGLGGRVVTGVDVSVETGEEPPSRRGR